MTLREEFESTGNWLFRWRSYLPLLLIGLILLALFEYEYPGNSKSLELLWESLCLIVSFFGLAVRVFTIGHTPKRTSGRNTKRQVAKALNTTGAYSVVRNPLYLGNFFMGLGIALFAHIWWLTLIYILVFWLYYERIIFAEEAYLKNKFGDEYIEWAKVTPIIVPNLRLYKKPSLRFSVRNVLKREYNGFFAVIIVLFVLDIASEFIVAKKFELDLMWAILLSVGLTVWITLRTLKKYTVLVKAEGR